VSTWFLLARAVGLSCVDDYDGDGVRDAIDVCPFASNIHTTSFTDNTQIYLDTSSQHAPAKWRVTNNVS